MSTGNLDLELWADLPKVIRSTRWYPRLSSILKNKEFIQLTQAFFSNIERISSLSIFPTSIFLSGMRMQMESIQYLIEEQKLPWPDCANLGSVCKHMDQRFVQYLNNKKSFYPVNSSIDEVFAFANEEDKASLTRIMETQIISTWTTFEIMCGDLWEAALNLHPKVLSPLRAKKGNQNPTGKELGKQLPMHYLEKNGYDVRTKMGTILKEHRSDFNFQTLDGIALAYCSAFPEDCDAGQENYWKDQEVRSLSAIRNIIVHKSGAIDEQFIKQRSSDPSLQQYKLGDNLIIDGSLVSRLVAGVSDYTAHLIAVVDQWIHDNP